ncbi:ATP phosphoribosyltransferase [Candidatus Nasuia deltocephalinicola]|uniref:ATP phosphoribosyltransferase n=1 Tax=Candidatus Nasuia deltocephalincola TaxID=1160784 RepID=UPI00216AF300|nr:ATP phosphoribosyltransferase [Candidatus Nasuia deltocephalinicola]
MKKILISSSKGRNLKEILIFLKKKKIIINYKKDNRSMYFLTNKKNIYFLILKNNDFKKYIKNNLIDFLLIGEDMTLNLNNYNIFYNYKFIKINIFYISLICNNKFIRKKKFKITTKYIKISKNYLYNKNINFKLKKFSGCIENSCILKKSDLIIDVVSSGLTLKKNKLFELKKILILNNILMYSLNNLYNKFFWYLENKYVKN